jgi:hypothetical protein
VISVIFVVFLEEECGDAFIKPGPLHELGHEVGEVARFVGMIVV